MGLIALLALFTPRLAIVLAWFFTDWFRNSFQTWVWPLLGFFILPFTTVWYGIHEYLYTDWVWWHFVLLVITVVVDMSSNKSVA